MAFFLDHQEVVEARKEKRLNVVQLVGIRDETARQYINLVVLLVRGKIDDDPYINPTVSLFLLVQLCTINRK